MRILFCAAGMRQFLTTPTFVTSLRRTHGRALQTAGVKRAQPDVHAASLHRGAGKAARGGGARGPGRPQGNSAMLPPQLRGRSAATWCLMLCSATFV